MIKEQKINRSKAINVVKTNIEALRKCNQTLESLYKIIFSHPDFEFLNVINNQGYETITYGKAESFIKRFAHYFEDNIKTDSKYVGLYLDNSKEWIYSFFGLLQAGFAPVLFSTANPQSEIDYVSKKLGISCVITNKTLEIPGIFVINPYRIDLPSRDESFKNKFGDEIVLLTSGTSGMPKIVFYSGEQICAQIYNAQKVLKDDKNINRTYKGELRHLVILPFYHIFGLMAVLVWFAFLNRTFVLPTGINARAIKHACELTKPTHIFAVPVFWESIVTLINTKCDTQKKAKKLRNAFRLSYSLQKNFGTFGNYLVRRCFFKKYLKQIFGTSIQYCISGGAFINEDTLKTINLLGYRLVIGYGATEIGITSLCNSNSIKKRLSVSIGKPFEFVEYKIQNDSLMVKAPSICKRIIDGEEDNYVENEFIDTNDIVKIENNEYFLFGRKDEIIIQHDGENLSIPLIEKQISLPLATDFAVLSDNNKLIFVASYSRTESIEKVIRELDSVGKTKAGSHISSIYYTNNSFEKANSIKVKRSVLLMQVKENKDEFIPLAYLKDHQSEIKNAIIGETLLLVIDAFKKVFPENEIKGNSHFYNELGGDSLKYFILLSEIETKLGRGLYINIENPPLTPDEFVKEIEKEQE